MTAGHDRPITGASPSSTSLQMHLESITHPHMHPPPTHPAQFYKLTNSHSQISSYVFDVVRASVPKLNLDDVFLEKEAIARSIQEVGGGEGGGEALSV